jgi:hypothetical protein
MSSAEVRVSGWSSPSTRRRSCRVSWSSPGPPAHPSARAGRERRLADQVVADDRDPCGGRVEGAQVAAELQEPPAGLARLYRTKSSSSPSAVVPKCTGGGSPQFALWAAVDRSFQVELLRTHRAGHLRVEGTSHTTHSEQASLKHGYMI